MTMTIVVPGPLHPDLFGGETPIMTPMQVRVFEVHATWNEPRRERYTVVAADEEQAQAVAERLVDDCTDAFEGLYFDIEEIDNPDVISQHMLARCSKILGEINAKPTPTTARRAR